MEEELQQLIGGKASRPVTQESHHGSIVLSKDDVSTSRFSPYLALSLGIVVIVFQILLIVLEVYLKRPGPFSTTEHLLYITGTTIIASLIAGFMSNQLRLLWLGSIAEVMGSKNPTAKQNFTHAKTLLGLGTVKEQLRSWPTSLTVLITGHITTSIVSSFAPSVSLVTQSSLYWLNSGLDYFCFVVSNTASNDWYSWKLANGSFISLNITAPYCVSQYAKMLVDQTLVPNGFSYTVNGVPVASAAIGTPVNIEGDFGYTLGAWGLKYGDSPLFQYATACVPILIRNPIRCRKTGNVTVGTNEVTVEADGCKIISPIFSVDPSLQGATSSGACTDGLDIGSATIVMGAVNSHAVLLAQVMYDSIFTPPPQEPATHAVACNVDMVPSIAFSLVNFSRLALQVDADSYYVNTLTYSVNGTEQLCTPLPAQSLSILTNYTLAVGAVAHQQLLSENSYRDGWWETIYDTAQRVSDTTMTGNSSTDAFNFSNSQSPLEDALGLVSGVVLGAYFMENPDSGSPFLTGSVAIDGIRIGTGQWLALLYIIPELYATLFILYFICIRKKGPASGSIVTSTS